MVVAKPAFETFTTYGPGCSERNPKWPPASVTLLCITPVSTESASTSAPTTTAPSLSATSPWIAPLMACTCPRETDNPMPNNSTTHISRFLFQLLITASWYKRSVQEQVIGTA